MIVIYRVWTSDPKQLRVKMLAQRVASPVSLSSFSFCATEHAWVEVVPKQVALAEVAEYVVLFMQLMHHCPIMFDPLTIWRPMVKVSPGMSRCFRPSTFQDQRKAWILQFVHNHWDDTVDFCGRKATQASVQDFVSCLLGKGPCSHLSAHLMSSGRAPFAVLTQTTHFTLETLKL